MTVGTSSPHIDSVNRCAVKILHSVFRASRPSVSELITP